MEPTIQTSALAQIIIATLPALAVAGVFWYMLQQFFAQQNVLQAKLAAQQQASLAQKQSNNDPYTLKLNAYERLTLLCERCEFMPLILRIQTAEMTADQLHAALMIGITQEFDHNVTQQIYVSETLWKLISSARANAYELLQAARHNAGTRASREQYIDAVFALVGDRNGNTPFQQALAGIRIEAGLLITN
jgi:hypothetical protein